MKLHSVNHPGRYRVTSLHVAHQQALELERMGILPGAVLDVLHNDFRGTMAVQVQGVWIILGRSETFHIQVAELPVSASQPGDPAGSELHRPHRP